MLAFPGNPSRLSGLPAVDLNKRIWYDVPWVKWIILKKMMIVNLILDDEVDN